MNVIWALWRLQIFTVWLWPCVLVYNALKLLWMIKDGQKMDIDCLQSFVCFQSLC